MGKGDLRSEQVFEELGERRPFRAGGLRNGRFEQLMFSDQTTCLKRGISRLMFICAHIDCQRDKSLHPVTQRVGH